MDTNINIDIEQARRLADLINESVSRLEALCDKSSSSNGFSSKSGANGIVDKGTEGGNGDIVQVITSAATQLAALVRPPAQVLLEVATGFTLSAALRLVAEANVPEIIRTLSAQINAKGNVSEIGVSLSDIARLSGVEDEKLERVLRLLATHHIFNECPPLTNTNEARFADNEISRALDSGSALKDILCNENDDREERKKQCWAAKYGAEAPGAGLSALVGILTDESMFHMTSLTEVLLNKELRTRSSALSSYCEESTSSNSIATNGDSDPDSPNRAPFSHARSLPHKTMFEWLSLPQNAHRLHRFGCAMRGMNGLENEDGILRGFDFASLPPNSIVIDVGGGVGAASIPILRANQHLRLVVQDTEEVVKVAPGFWEKHYPEALREGRVRFQVQDFFENQPERYFDESGPEKAQKVFLLRMITHNWGDAHCVRILECLGAAAMDQDRTIATTRLVLIDSVLMPAYRSPSSASETMQSNPLYRENIMATEAKSEGQAKIREAPEPLLANWGVANSLAYRLDLIMLANHNARERTLSGFSSLLSRAGWAIEAVHHNNNSNSKGVQSGGESWMPQIVAFPVKVGSGSGGL